MMTILRNPGLIIQLFVIILNPWFWVIIQRNFLQGLLAVSLSIIVFLYFWQNKSKALFILLVVFTLTIFALAAKVAFDESIFSNSALDIQQINKRHEFYAKGLGKIYTNRISLTYFKDFRLPLYKLQRNFFGNLDLNLYFFASHPRERLGVKEFEKYLPIFLPFFLLGVIYSLYKPLPKILLYIFIISLVSSIISSKYNLGPILFFPIVNFIITIGAILSLQKIFKYPKK